ncbi:uncharacterized protein LOC132257865 [Phlebotomus argentipes]|uniref:uncharacterized protein LOC132257865 n=1 Tax=Phlebotomus argentipes TaxID=94469 RepID=UPI002892F1E3|nr:uncharacterized protein LOC132257865 [Phlebotomus argentipes]
MSVFKWKVLVILCSCVLFRTILSSTVPIRVESVESKAADRPKFTGLLPIVRHCVRQSEIIGCFKNYAIEKLDNAIESDRSYVINEFISIKRDPNYQRELAESGESERSINQILFSRIRDFIASRIISIKFTPNFMEEGRKKKYGGGKHGHGMMMGGFAMVGMMLHLVLGKLAFLAGAALLMAKMSLFLSLMGSMKKLVTGGSSGDSHVVVTEHGHGHGGGYGGNGWQRSINSRTPDGDQQLPYKGYTSSELAGV